MTASRQPAERRAPALGPRQQALFHACLAILLASGALWLYAHYLPEQLAGAGDTDCCDPWTVEAWALRVHGAAAMLALFGLGTLLHTHMRVAWRQQRNRATGLAMAITVLVLVASGYGLYYFTGDAPRHWASWLHRASGFGLPLLLAWHAIAGRRSR